MLIIGCGMETQLSRSNEDRLLGSWTSIFNNEGHTHTFNFNEGQFEGVSNGVIIQRGNYSIVGDDISMTVTQLYYPESSEDEGYRWFTRDEFLVYHKEMLELISSQTATALNPIDLLYFSMTYRMQFDGNDLFLSYPTELDYELTSHTTVDELKENAKNFRNQTVNESWVTQKFTRI
jgi:hypothetical protein